MNKINKQLNKINGIFNNIKNDNSLKLSSDANNINKIINVKKNKYEKKKLDYKINKINLFADKLVNLINNLPNPNKLDKKLLEFTVYKNYYDKHKIKSS